MDAPGEWITHCQAEPGRFQQAAAEPWALPGGHRPIETKVPLEHQNLALPRG